MFLLQLLRMSLLQLHIRSNAGSLVQCGKMRKRLETLKGCKCGPARQRSWHGLSQPASLLILVRFQVETNYPGPCRQASQRLGVCRHPRQASFKLTHNLCLAKTPSDEKLNRSPDVLTVKSRWDPPDSC